MINEIKLSEGIVLLIAIWIMCTAATIFTKKNYIETAVTLTFLYAFYRLAR